jgi:hypothetical protein
MTYNDIESTLVGFYEGEHVIYGLGVSVLGLPDSKMHKE